ncbi:MAG: RlpA-like double-psi beta-barrel domain-containing protein [Solirubrobacteraceae bacterium]
MRAKQLRAVRAKKTGTLSLTMVTAAVVLGTASAGAIAAQSGSRPATATPSTGSASTGGASTGSASPLTARAHVAVAREHLLIHRAQFVRPSGSTVVVHGRLEPRRRNAEVQLETRTGRRWHTLAVGRTHPNGHFGIHYRVHGLGSSRIRVRFGGSRRARAVSAAAGRIVALTSTVASWYYDAGNTACGFHATYGVANKTLPCGTKVTLSYGGHTVIATVDDRGPYVYGRSFDLNQTTARYLGMWGVGTVFASV